MPGDAHRELYRKAIAVASANEVRYVTLNQTRYTTPWSTIDEDDETRDVSSRDEKPEIRNIRGFLEQHTEKGRRSAAVRVCARPPAIHVCTHVER